MQSSWDAGLKAMKGRDLIDRTDLIDNEVSRVNEVSEVPKEGLAPTEGRAPGFYSCVTSERPSICFSVISRMRDSNSSWRARVSRCSVSFKRF